MTNAVEETMLNKTVFFAALAFFLGNTTFAEPTPSTVSPWDKDDGQWITISGKVTEAAVHTFKLDYGKGAITVEMDDYDREIEGFNLVVDDRVIVTGRVDADAGQNRTIEAASVYVKNVKKSFFANPDDEEEVIRKLRKATVEGSGVVITGKIIGTAPNFLTIDTGYQVFDVTTAVINGNPTTNLKSLKLEKGDTVTVYGAITDGFVDSGKIVASNLAKH